VNIQNQAKTHQPADPYQPTTAAYGSPPAQTHSMIEDRELVHAEGDDYGIDTNILNDELTHEVIAPYTGVWWMHGNTMAHEAMVEPYGGQPPSVIAVIDEGLEMAGPGNLGNRLRMERGRKEVGAFVFLSFR